MNYDAVIKILIEGECETFFGLLGAEAPRHFLPTETFTPFTLRLDHLSVGPNDDILHIEFQSKWEEMRWRMLEYYCSIARNRNLQALPSRTTSAFVPVRQFVILMGGASRMPGELKRDHLVFGFEVLDLTGIDPDRRLLASSNIFEQVLGLLCMRRVHNRDWARVLRSIRAAREETPERARDAAALLMVVAKIQGASKALDPMLEEFRMRLNVEDSPVLARMVREKLREGAREGALAMFQARLAGMGIDIAQDPILLEHLSVESMVDAEHRLSAEEPWLDIRDRIVGASYAPPRLGGDD